MRILIVEDDAILRKSLVQGLTEAGHECLAAGDGDRGLAMIRQSQPDLIVLDVMLPGRSGMDVLRSLRDEKLTLPVLMLTAMGSVENRVEGLTLGADDYLVKPFAFAELLARVDAIGRRALSKPATSLSTGKISLDLVSRRVTIHGRTVELTPTEFSVLELLMRFEGQVVPRELLCKQVWGFTWEGNTNVIEVHINRLRQKIDSGDEESSVRTVRGRGYALRVTE